jgi:hypothetical protein
MKMLDHPNIGELFKINKVSLSADYCQSEAVFMYMSLMTLEGWDCKCLYWVAALCSVEGGYQCFGGSCYPSSGLKSIGLGKEWLYREGEQQAVPVRARNRGRADGTLSRSVGTGNMGRSCTELLLR